MPGLMQVWPLTLSKLIEHVEISNLNHTAVPVSVDYRLKRFRRKEIASRTKQLLPHPELGERLLLIIVQTLQTELPSEHITHWFKSRTAKLWLPDAICFLDEIPHTATGKILKTALREQFQNFRFDPESADRKQGAIVR